MRSALFTAWFGAVIAAGPVMAASTEEATPKHGGTLTYMIPADAPPSLDGHREGTFAILHATAPFYSVLMRVNPENPSDTTNFVCDLCTALPTPTDDGKTYSAKVIGTDPRTDLALIKVDGKDFPYVKLSDTAPRVGDWVLAVGNPFGLGAPAATRRG